MSFVPFAIMLICAWPTESVTPAAAGYDPDRGFFVASPDDAYQLRIGFVGGYKLEPVETAGTFQDRTEFTVLRPFLAGHLWKKWIQFQTMLELVGNPPYVLDSYVDVRPIPQVGVRAGLQPTPFSREKSFAPNQLLFPDWAVAAEYFWSGHDKGATLLALPYDERVAAYFGVYSGSPLRQFVAVAGNYVLEGRLTLSPLGKIGHTEYPYISEAPAPFLISFTLQGYYGKVTPGTENFDTDSFQFTFVPIGVPVRKATAGADIFVQGERFMAFAEGYLRRTDPGDGSPAYDAEAIWGEAGLLVVPRWVDAGVRVNWINPSTSLSNVRTLIGEAQLSYYVHPPVLVLKLRYGIADQQTPGMAALGPVVLPIAPGRSQLLTLQLNVAY